MKIQLWLSLGFALTLAGTASAETSATNQSLNLNLDNKPGLSVACWATTSLQRVFPASPPGSTNLHLLAPRGGKISFQACVKNQRWYLLNATCSILATNELRAQVRRVGYVPLPHLTPHTEPEELDGLGYLPGFGPDPLFPTPTANIAPWESQSFWITLDIPADARPGLRQLKVKFTFPDSKKSVEWPVTVEISSFVLQPRRDFHVTHWWRGEALWDYYKTGMFEDERWWQLTEAYLKNMIEHGSDVLYAPIFFNRRETFQRPCQLLGISEPTAGKYEFDWTQVKRFTDLGKKLGFKKFEWSHLWIYWGVKNPIRAYKKEGDQWVMLWPPDTGATSETYLNFLKQFLPAFHRFLTDENVLADSYFHLSDEPGKSVPNYKAARQVLRDLAPWMQVMDALSDIEYGRDGLTDMPVPEVKSAMAYVNEKIPHWVYYCTWPRGQWLNRFCDTPLPKIRMSGWLFYRLGAKGFLHWGFNYYHRFEQEGVMDPFQDAASGVYPTLPFGDPFVVYPGENGPLDSIRWEVFAESLQDYAVLQTAGIRPEDKLLSEIKTYADFPKSEAWIQNALEKILRENLSNGTE